MTIPRTPTLALCVLSFSSIGSRKAAVFPEPRQREKGEKGRGRWKEGNEKDEDKKKREEEQSKVLNLFLFAPLFFLSHTCASHGDDILAVHDEGDASEGGCESREKKGREERGCKGATTTTYISPFSFLPASHLSPPPPSSHKSIPALDGRGDAVALLLDRIEHGIAQA